MKTRNSQNGNAVTIVIIVVLVIAVLGLLGFVFWQSFLNKPKTDNATQTSQTTSTDSATQNTKTLTVTEWGVKGSYKSDQTISYTVNQFGSLTLTDSALDSSCGSIGSISKGTANEDAIVGSTSGNGTNQEAYAAGDGNARAKVGDNYYFYTGPQTTCEADAANQASAVQAVVDFVNSLQAS